MPDFTPGPWELVPANEHHGPYICSPWGSSLCDLYAMSDPPVGARKAVHFVDAEANSHLIAAAPDLYEALADVTDSFVAAFAQVGDPNNAAGWADPEHFVSYQRMQTALAKARGETP